MAVLDKITLPENGAVEAEVLQLLVSHLGPSKAAVFMREHYSRKTDYLETKEHLFGDSSMQTLVQEIKQHREG